MSIYIVNALSNGAFVEQHQEKCSLIFFSLNMMFMAFDVNNKVRIELLANTCMFLCKTFDKKIPRFFKTEKMKSVTEVPGT